MEFSNAVQAAIAIIQEEARILHECSTDENGGWGEDEAAEASYNHMLIVAKALRDGVNDARLQDMHAATFDLPLATPNRLPGVRGVVDPVAAETARCAAVVRSVCVQVDTDDGETEVWSMERLAQMIEGKVPVPDPAGAAAAQEVIESAGGPPPGAQASE